MGGASVVNLVNDFYENQYMISSLLLSLFLALTNLSLKFFKSQSILHILNNIIF